MGIICNARAIRGCAVGLVLTVLGNLLVAGTARGTTLAVEPFSYADGALFGESGGTGWTAIWTGFSTDVSGGEALAIGPAEVGSSASRPFGNPGATPILFVSVDFTTPASLALSDSWGVILRAGVNFSNLVIGKDAGSSVFAVGNSGFFFDSSVTVLASTSYHLVGAYDLANQRVSLWIDPDGSDFYDPATGANSADVSALSSVAFHMDGVSLGGTMPGARFDNVVIGNAPGDVLLSVPEPSILPLLLASGITASRIARKRRL